MSTEAKRSSQLFIFSLPLPLPLPPSLLSFIFFLLTSSFSLCSLTISPFFLSSSISSFLYSFSSFYLFFIPFLPSISSLFIFFLPSLLPSFFFLPHSLLFSFFPSFHLFFLPFFSLIAPFLLPLFPLNVTLSLSLPTHTPHPGRQKMREVCLRSLYYPPYLLFPYLRLTSFLLSRTFPFPDGAEASVRTLMQPAHKCSLLGISVTA